MGDLSLERAKHGRRERLGHRGVVRGGGEGALGLAADRQLGQARALPGKAGREHLVDHDAERVDVGGGSRLAAARLLGREVGGGADDGADLRDPGLLGGPGDAEVRQLHGHLVGRRIVRAEAELRPGGPADHHQVARLHVAVDDPLAVRVLEARAGLDADRDGDLRAEPAAALEELGDGAALDVLHDDVVAIRDRRPCRRPGRCWGG